jgi:sterol desaturase/sphingolipid hydroxylase (fatty acid hydroxylase superfamily)
MLGKVIIAGLFNFAKMFPIFVGIVLLEELGPTIGLRMSWRVRLRNVGLWGVYIFGGAVLCGVAQPVLDALYIRPLLRNWAFPGGILAALVAGDFAYYWFHRFEHRFLWRWHAVHHSPRELAGVSGYSHPAESLLQTLFWTIPAGILMPNPFGPLVLFLITQSWDQYVHSNTALGLGRWRVLLADNRFHRIHHSLTPEHWNHNFGVMFPWWDMMFGTAWMPGRDEWPEVGVPEYGEIRSVGKFLATPLIRAKRTETSTALPSIVED